MARSLQQSVQCTRRLWLLVVTLSEDSYSLEIHNSIFGSLDELFGFPKEIKLQNTNDIPFRGYLSPNSVDEGLGIDAPMNPEAVQKFTKLFWPRGNDRFCETAISYARVVTWLD